MKIKQITSLITIFLLTFSHATGQTITTELQDSVAKFFQFYHHSTVHLDVCSLRSLTVNDSLKQIEINASDPFGEQPFTTGTVKYIYQGIQKILPSTYQSYQIQVRVGRYEISQLIPNIYSDRIDSTRLWRKLDYNGNPWVLNTSRPFNISKGLQNRHITVWQSHGRYYNNSLKKWTWQRPYLYCTNEDLLTQTFVVPFLIPMLQNAGAVVFTPRERDWQTHELIIDNDTTPRKMGVYWENAGKHPWSNCAANGFAQMDSVYFDNENPFTMGTVRQSETVSDKLSCSSISWMPNFPDEGNYAVYVSYKTTEKSINNAQYTVYHKGVATSFSVNQQMGSQTWVYLGTFSFDKGTSTNNRVILSNFSQEKGVVTADAVRFGGGMGNIARGDSIASSTVSGLPRYLEGARYACQWAGMPHSVYCSKGGVSDYGDDINARSLTENYLGGGSVFCPDSTGLKVPMELSVALHSDAGTDAQSIVGSLSICTTNHNNGILPSGVNRLASRDLCDMLLTDIDSDMKKIYGKWTRRKLYDRNYSETRLPNVPSCILEMFSHQNFSDMCYAHDPNFKFNFARSVYKTLLKYISYQHGINYVVQPLPVKNFSVTFSGKRNEVTLHWDATSDSLESTATPSSYVVYTKDGSHDFNNGVSVSLTSYTCKIDPGKIYSFRITAVNQGGESFPSETLCAYVSRNPRHKILIVNGFQRLSGPAIINTPKEQGFNIKSDIGVPYFTTPEYAGAQQCFDTSRRGIEGASGLGYSGNELEGRLIMGNTFNYPAVHGSSIVTASGYSFVSCNRDCIEKNLINLKDYDAIDLILGAQKNVPQNIQNYKTFSPELQKAIKDYCSIGGNVFISGEYISSGLESKSDIAFARDVLKYAPDSLCINDSITSINGFGTDFSFLRQPNETCYAIQYPDAITSIAPGKSLINYENGTKQTAAVAYKGRNYRTFSMSIPFEGITDATKRNELMRRILQFLFNK